MEAMKAFILAITILNLVSQSRFFYCTVSYLQYSLQCKQFLVFFIDSRSEKKYIKISQNKQEKTSVGVSFFLETSGLELY